VMLVPGNARELQPDGVAYVPVPGDETFISMFWRKAEESPAARTFREVAAAMPSEELVGATRAAGD
jgi:hypothetical protein